MPFSAKDPPPRAFSVPKRNTYMLSLHPKLRGVEEKKEKETKEKEEKDKNSI